MNEGCSYSFKFWVGRERFRALLTYVKEELPDDEVVCSALVIAARLESYIFSIPVRLQPVKIAHIQPHVLSLHAKSDRRCCKR